MLLTPLPPVLFLPEEYIHSYHILRPLQVSRLSQRLQCLPVHDSVDNLTPVSLSADPGIMGEGLMGKELSEKPYAIENLTEFLLSI